MPEETQEQPQTDASQVEDQQQAAPAAQEQAAAEAAEEQDNLPPNTVAVEEAGTLKKRLTVTVHRERIDAKSDEMFGELSRSAQVPGFRIGRAPRRLIEKRFGKEVSHDVRNALIGEALGDAVQQAELKTIGEPEIDLDAIKLPETGDMEFAFEVEVVPEFDLPELKGIKVERPSAEATDAKLDDYMDELRHSRAAYEATDKPARKEDVVLASAVISGEGMETVERPGLTLRVAPGQIEGLPLVDLGEALAGRKAGETAELTLAVPEAHPNEDWRGKEVKVAVTISSVRRHVLPKLDEQFARSAGFDSIDEMRQFHRARLAQRLAVQSQRSLRDQICQFLLDNTALDVPEGVAERYTDRMLQRQYVDLLQMGIPHERIDERLTELQAAAQQRAQRELKLQFILGKIIEEEAIAVEDAEVNARVAQIAQWSDRRPERLRQELAADGSLEQLEVSLREEKALDMLLADAEVTEAVEPEPEKPKAKAKRKKTGKAAGKTRKKAARKSAKASRSPKPGEKE
jgi:trigger factor